MSNLDFDAILSLDLGSIDDLPPMGVPPTGNYTMLVTASRESKQGKNDYFMFKYEVIAVNEVKNADEATQAAVGMKFSEFFSPLKADGSTNEFGVQYLKAAVAPFAQHFGSSTFGDAIQQINSVEVTADLTRRRDKKDEDRWLFSLKNVVIA